MCAVRVRRYSLHCRSDIVEQGVMALRKTVSQSLFVVIHFIGGGEYVSD
jgi:hypothetical protein